MRSVIDSVDAYIGMVKHEFPEWERIEIAGTLIGYYIEWAYKKGFAPDEEKFLKVINSEVNGTKFLIEELNSEFSNKDINKEGYEFTRYGYDRYIRDVYSLLGHGLFIENYNKADYDRISAYLDELYERYTINEITSGKKTRFEEDDNQKANLS